MSMLMSTDRLHTQNALAPIYKIIRIKELSQLIGLSRSTIYDRLNPKSKRFDPSFPRPIKLGLASVGWNLCEVMAWIASRPQAHPITAGKE
ncbi:helix-turn-helix transcriptional regulator [Aeromonas dhakensis]|uniref:helix-turn-helix transcriptional regulator n=1 Tax=Aeromonas dhakensis TaxID=196024 RepID=UPI001FCBD174|nr:AlpA family phage regulatory protein [Aeromonas dhakensis]MCJ2366582.1 AlpA family phage regulatory protein [Aeromonas dhakensis]